MEILDQLESKIGEAICKIKELQARVKELEGENEEYRSKLPSLLADFDATLGSIGDGASHEEESTEGASDETEAAAAEEWQQPTEGGFGETYHHSSE